MTPPSQTMRGLRLPPHLEVYRPLIEVDRRHGLSLDEVLALLGVFDAGDPCCLDRTRVIAQLRLLHRLHQAGMLQSQPRPGFDEKTGFEAQTRP